MLFIFWSSLQMILQFILLDVFNMLVKSTSLNTEGPLFLNMPLSGFILTTILFLNRQGLFPTRYKSERLSTSPPCRYLLALKELLAIYNIGCALSWSTCMWSNLLSTTYITIIFIILYSGYLDLLLFPLLFHGI